MNFKVAVVYQQTSTFWRPELMQDPPDMVALPPRWVPTGLAMAFVLAAIYARFRPAISGADWKRGAALGWAADRWCPQASSS